MTCFHPLKAFKTTTGVSFVERKGNDYLGDLALPCGMCVGCRMRRNRDWALRMRHEASMWENNCFVTLTYARDKCPPWGSLCHRDWQNFMKKVRYEQAEKTVRTDMHGPVRFYMCGEYGSLNHRPHFHACFFNLDFDDKKFVGKSHSGQDMYESKTLSSLWQHGASTLQTFTMETATYVSGYVMQLALGRERLKQYQVCDIATGELIQLKPEYSEMSTMPYMYKGIKRPGGIGAAWFEKYKKDVTCIDAVVADGMEHQTPAYYDKLYAKCAEGDIDEVKYKRFKKAMSRNIDATPERMAVRESLALAKLERKKREL